MIVPGCSGGIDTPDYTDRNPFWYAFTAFRSGPLTFTITPFNAGDDYDWQLYDVTNVTNINDVYSNPSLVVTGNWAGTYGATGASASGVTYIQCASIPEDNAPSFARSPVLIQGHNYLLMVSHFTATQSGYTLNFTTGAPNITDTLTPKLQKVTAACDATSLTVTFNKKMLCSSLTNGGTEFVLSPPLATVTGANSSNCSRSFSTTGAVLTLSNPLPPGSYFLKVRQGTDGNSVQDICKTEIAYTDSIPLTILPLQPTPMDSLTKPGCAPDQIELVFDRPIRCNSFSVSDFAISGTYPVSISSVSGNCDNGVTSSIFVKFAAPLLRAGNFSIKLVVGSDGNTIIDECGQETPSSILTFSTKDTVNADFRYFIRLGCERDTVNYFHPGGNGINSWNWTFDGIRTSTLQSPTIFYGTFGNKFTQLIVSNGVCSDTSSQTIFLSNTLKAGFESMQLVCPNEPVVFKDTSIGNIVAWNWNFGNGQVSQSPNPPNQLYTFANSNFDVPVTLTVTNNLGCQSSITHYITILNNCYIAVPSAFTPNGDGLNDFLYPLNAYKTSNLQFSVYNRAGQRLFNSNNWLDKWDGKFKGKPCEMGTYVWILSYVNLETGKFVEQKGSTVLIR